MLVLIVLQTILVVKHIDTTIILPSCLEVGQVAWSNVMPFVSNMSTNNPQVKNESILPKVLEQGLAKCCRGEINLNYSLEFKNQNEVIDLIKNYSVQFIMPLQKSKRSNKYFHNPYIPIVQSPGLAHYIQKQPNAGEIIIVAISSTWPLLTIMFILVAMSAIIFHIVESMTLRLNGEESQPFRKGICEGIWWAFVSMTTVGYGDICPKTKPGRVFSMIWVIIGVAACAIFTSHITTILTSSCLTESNEFKKVGVIIGSEELRYAKKKGIQCEEFQSTDEMIKKLESHHLEGILIDAYVAGQYKERLKEFQLQGIIEHITTIGVAFLYGGIQYAPCVRDFIYSQETEISKTIAETVQLLKISSTSKAEEKSSNLTNIDSKESQLTFVIMLALIILICMIGITRDYIKSKRRALYSSTQNEMSLTEWRCKYKNEFQILLQAMKDDAELVHVNCSSILTQIRSHGNGIVRRKQENLLGQYWN